MTLLPKNFMKHLGWIKRLFYKFNKVSLSKKGINHFSTSSSYQISWKKDRYKTLFKNCRPISLLNVDLETISKAFSSRLKTVLTSIMSSEQTAYIEKRSIGESGRLISVALYVTNNLKIKSYLITTDIEKDFDSLDDSFLISGLKKLDLGKSSLIGSKFCYISKNHVYWTEVLQQSILILKKLLVKVIQFLHIYSFLH